MAETLPDFINRRLAELDKAVEPLRAGLRKIQLEIAEIDKERNQLHRALAAVSEKEINQTALFPPELVANYSRRRTQKTMKETILDILAEYPEGQIAIDILAELNSRLGSTFLRTSLSPQLSRLKADGLISLNGNIWTLAPKDKAADANLGEGSSAAFSETPEHDREAGQGGGT